ncbi:MAG: peptidoglycan-binding protein [Actinomycetota bacterium]|jgi:hypothetical protein
MTTSQHSASPDRRKRASIARRLILAIVVIAIVAVCVVLSRRTSTTKTVAPAAVLKPATIASGDLSTTERIDGSVLLSSSIQVLHRVEAQQSTSTGGGGSSAAPSAAAAASPATAPGAATPSRTATARTGASTNGASTSATSASSNASQATTQTITSIIAVGTPVAAGDLLYTVDNQSVIALYGALPAWRSMSTSSSDGPDIKQLEYNLVALGYDSNNKVTVDNHFDSNTAAMVKAWQTGRGDTATGSVPLGSVVFVPTATTVLEVAAKLGGKVSDGTKIVTLAAATQQVVIDVPAADQARVAPGLKVSIGQGDGTVSLLRSVVRSGAVVVQAVIDPTKPIDNVSNGATVSVSLNIDSLKGVLIAPAQALVSRLDGTYAMQVQATDGSLSWHTVELLATSGSKVGIRGDGIAEGTIVMVPVS